MKSQSAVLTQQAVHTNTEMGLRILITLLILSTLILIAPIFHFADSAQAQQNVSGLTISSFDRDNR